MKIKIRTIKPFVIRIGCFLSILINNLNPIARITNKPKIIKIIFDICLGEDMILVQKSLFLYGLDITDPNEDITVGEDEVDTDDVLAGVAVIALFTDVVPTTSIFLTEAPKTFDDVDFYYTTSLLLDTFKKTASVTISIVLFGFAKT